MPRAKYDYSRGGVEKASLIDVVAVGIMETDDGKYVRIDIQKDGKEFHLAMSLEDCAFIEEAPVVYLETLMQARVLAFAYNHGFKPEKE